MNEFHAPGESHTYGGGISQTAFHPFFLAILILVVISIFVLPRKHLIIPFTIGIFLIPLGEQFYAVGVHWLVGRVIILVTLARVVLSSLGSEKSPLGGGGYNSMDKAYIWCIITQSVAFILLYKNTGSIIFQLGFLIDYIAAYYVLRVMIQNNADVYRTLKTMAVVALILAIGMTYEQKTMTNVFGMLGGTHAVPDVREGKIRSHGSFQHSLTAGTYGATLIPLFLMLWRNGRSQLMASLGLLSCTVMTICSNSSTPLLGWVSGCFALALWPVRKEMQTVRRGFVLTLVALHMVMKAPVWFLIARVDLTGGSSGYHRAELVDQFINHFWEWWLIGTNNAANWGWDLWDQQNQFVNVGQTGGLLALGFFILTIKRAYSRIGDLRKSSQGSGREWQMWFLGAALFSNIASFFGVNYFDQVKVCWLILLAIIAASTNEVKKRRPADAEETTSMLETTVEEPEQAPA